MNGWIGTLFVTLGGAAVFLILYVSALAAFAWALDRACKETDYCECRKCTERKDRKNEAWVSRGHLFGTARYYGDQASRVDLTDEVRSDALAMADWLDQVVANRIPRYREQPERPTRPDGSPYSFAEITARGWSFCDGCRLWTTATIGRPHNCVRTYAQGPATDTSQDLP